jgi:tRNA (adenine37-N6)-methyltransferase
MPDWYSSERIHTPWTSRLETPRQGRADGPLCRIEVFEPWVMALDSLAQFESIEVHYWLHLSRRDLVMQSPASDGTSRGTFSLRSPARPNPIGTAIGKLISVEGAIVMVRGLDCLDGTPLLDLKPDRTFVQTNRAAATRRFPGRRSLMPQSGRGQVMIARGRTLRDLLEVARSEIEIVSGVAQNCVPFRNGTAVSRCSTRQSPKRNRGRQISGGD